MPQSGKSDESIRLNRFIAACGVTSRRKAEGLIQAGKIKVNGQTVIDLATQVTPADTVEYQGRILSREPFVYLMLNKPKNTITAKKDNKGRRTVMDLLARENLPDVFPVGRLDRNTSGILLLTNDGQLANKLMHPRRKVEKAYLAVVDKPVPAATLAAMAEPQYVDDDYLEPHSLLFPQPPDKKRIVISVSSGQNRVVRRMLTKWGYHVKNLDRVSYAGLEKNQLKPGQWRYLKGHEVNSLKNKAGL